MHGMTFSLPSQPILQVICHDGPCIGINKPAGVLTQAPAHIDSLEQRVKEYLRQLEGKSGNVYVGVPHRLDRPVSGIIVFARHVRATRRIAEQFEGRSVTKKYWAWVTGRFATPSGRWVDTIRKIPGEARAEMVEEGHPEGKSAILRYDVREEQEQRSWVEIQLETGRTHQIRAQLAHHGFPIVGDELYGSRDRFGPACDAPRDRAIALHARSLSFRHPMTHEPVEWVAPVPDYWPRSVDSRENR